MMQGNLSALPADETSAEAAPSQLASFLAAKLCHDFASPAGAVINGLDMMRDPDNQDMRDEFMGLVETSARKLLSMVHFARVAFGAASSAESFSADEVEVLARSVFEGIRPDLEWNCGVERFSKPQARAALNLAQISGGALATGGLVRLAISVIDDKLVMLADAQGARARLKQEVATGLEGRTLTEGLTGQWTQPYWLYTTVSEAGGRLATELGEDRVAIRITMPV
jgi:histidine phosphotransferase ChpT